MKHAYGHLGEFVEDNGGIRLIMRRHFQYRSPVDLPQAYRLTRMIRMELQGLTGAGRHEAFLQGCQLQKLGMIPNAIYCAFDQRNLEGAQTTADGLVYCTPPAEKRMVPVYQKPGIAFPNYRDPKHATELFDKYGDPLVHMHLSGRFQETAGLWTELVAEFIGRLMAAVDAAPADELQLWDLNYEQITALYHLLVVGKPIGEIETGENYFKPQYGGGIVIGKNGKAALFTGLTDARTTR